LILCRRYEHHFDAVKSPVTALDYLRKNRYFLEFGGFSDPTKMCHKLVP
jgi:hypothetical protein